jgi:hypothetical protein
MGAGVRVIGITSDVLEIDVRHFLKRERRAQVFMHAAHDRVAEFDDVGVAGQEFAFWVDQ